MTLRLALLLLLLVNGVLLAANTGVFGPEVSKAWFESEREPDRMRRQIRTDEILISPTGTGVRIVGRRTQIGARVGPSGPSGLCAGRIRRTCQPRTNGSDHR